MEKWRYGPEKAWTAMHAIAKTLEIYLDEYIIGSLSMKKRLPLKRT